MSESIIKNPGADRFCVFPIKHHNLWDFYKKHISTFWTVEEVLLSDDLSDWKKLNDNEQYFVKNVLAFFAASDGIVNENLVLNFYNEVQIPEARQFYAVQMMIEAVHGEQYSLLIDTYIQDSKEKEKLFNAVETIPAVKRKAEWAMKWIEEGSTLQQMIPEKHMEWLRFLEESDQYQDEQLNSNIIEALKFLTKEKPSFAQRLLAFVCVEGIFFSGSFCAIYWLKNRGLMPGLATANEFISRDEGLHAEFAIELYKMLDNQLDENTVHEIFKEAVDIEKEFVTESLPVSLLGMNSDLMSQYIQFVADRWLVMLGYNKLYKSENPFGFMEMISVNTKENFFETRVSQYQKAGIGQSEVDRTIAFDDDDF
jgi:ribonucleoside-diphosphate reductase beta chain